MIRPRLCATSIDPLVYLDERFPADLAFVVQPSEKAYPRLSVSSFCPDWPKGDIYTSPGHAFATLNDSLWFLSALFVKQALGKHQQLPAEAAFAHARTNAQHIVLVGTLGSYWDEMSPALLLLVIALYDLPVPLGTVSRGMCMMLEAEATDLRPTPSGNAPALSSTRRMLTKQHMPDSLRAFVPHGDRYAWQPNREVVRELRNDLLVTLDRIDRARGAALGPD